MTVYVDPSRWPYRGQLYCHVWADTAEELHTAAVAAGLKRAWFQQPPKASWCHYDCAPRIRAILVHNGAVETDEFGAVEFVAKQRNNVKMIDNIALCRTRRNEQRIQQNQR